MRIAVIGRTSLLYDTALALRANGHEVACVITAPAAPEYTRTADDFRRLADTVGAPFFCAARGTRPDFETLGRGADIAVSINWISVLSSQDIARFRLGVLNAHHGDLPAYRGNACSNWAILRGESSITATIHLMEGGALDCGRVICQERHALSSDTTIGDIYDWSAQSTPRLFAHAIELLDGEAGYTLKVAKLDGAGSFRCYPRMPEDMYIDWARPAAEVHALVRASSRPFAGAYTFHWNDTAVKKLRVLATRIVSEQTPDVAMPGQVLENNRQTGESLVRCGDGVLAIASCRYEDETDEFAPGGRWTSIRLRLGVRAEDWLWHVQESKK